MSRRRRSRATAEYGPEPTPDVLAVLDQWAAGEISDDQLTTIVEMTTPRP